MAFTFSWGLKIPVTTAKEKEKRIDRKIQIKKDNFFIGAKNIINQRPSFCIGIYIAALKNSSSKTQHH